MTRVLLCIDESPASLASTRGLRSAGYEPWLAASQPGTSASRSRDAAGVTRLPAPQADPERYARELAALADRIGAAAVLPATESTLRALSGRESLFTAPVGACGAEALERATDKTALAREGARVGLPSPPSLELSASDDLSAVELPVVAKPVRTIVEGADGTLRTVDVTRADDVETLRRALEAEAPAPMLVQRYVAGELGAVSGIAWAGEVLATSHQRSARIWPPGRGITAYGRTVEPDPALDRAVRELLAWVGWSGIFQVQVIHGTDRPWLIDLNPRIYGSIGLAISAGLNLPAIWADLLLGREPRIGAPRIGQGYRVEEDDLRALVGLFRSGRRREALSGALPRRHTAHAALALRDPLPFLSTLAKAGQRLRRSPKDSSTS